VHARVEAVSVAERRDRLRDAWPFAFILVVAFASRMVWFGDPVSDFDEQLYSLIGNGLLAGKLPYVDYWDRKPFGLFLLFGLAHLVGGPGPLSYQVLAALFTAAGGFAVYALARTMVDRATAAGAGAIYPPLAYAYGCFSGQSEVFFIPLTLAMLLLVRDIDRPDGGRRAALAMLLGGLALQIKYTVIVQCLFVGCVALWHFRSEPPLQLAARAASYAALGLFPTVTVGALYAAFGHWDAFWFANFVSIFERAPAAVGRLDMRHLSVLSPLLLLAAGGVYALLRFKRFPHHRDYALVAGWTMAALAGVLVPGTVYIYYYVAVVPGAILLALPLLDRRGALGWGPLAVVGAASVLLLNVPRHYAETRDERAEYARLVAALRPYVGQTRDCLLVYDGPTDLYRATGSCIPSRFVYPDHLNNALETDALGAGQTAEVARLLALRPGAIVTADKPVTEQNPDAGQLVAQAIRAHYLPLAVAVLRERTYRAWVRPSLPSTRPSDTTSFAPTTPVLRKSSKFPDYSPRP